MRYRRDVTKATSGILGVMLACSGKTQQTPAVEDAPRVAIDAAPPIDAPPFAVEEKKSGFGNSIEIRPHGAKCPGIEWRREPKTVAIDRCRDQPLSAQTDALREMVAYLRTIDRSVGDDVRVVGLGDYYSYPELAKRFVAYAKTHPYSNKIGIHKWVIAAANSGDMMPELAVIFQLKPSLSSVEKCSTGRATHKTEIGQFIRDAGGTGNAEIPVGCSMAVYAFER